MPTDYLNQFREAIKADHSDSPPRCHWRSYDDLFDEKPEKAADRKGLCNCPGKQPCDDHSQLVCASTADVLGQRVPSEFVYAGNLKTLAAVDDDLRPALQKGEEALRNLISGGKTLQDALNDDTLTAILHGYWGENMAAKKAARTIASMAFPDGPRPHGTEGKGCDCACWKAKDANLTKEDAKLKTLIKDCNTLSTQLTRVCDDLTATFMNTLFPVLKGSWKVVKGVGGKDLEKVADGLKELYEYYRHTTTEGGKILAALRLARLLSTMKRLAMLGIIYHDQQRKALTCQPTEKQEKKEAHPPKKAPKKRPVLR